MSSRVGYLSYNVIRANLISLEKCPWFLGRAFSCVTGEKKSKFHKSLFPVISPLFIFLQGLFHNVKFIMQELGSYVLI